MSRKNFNCSRSELNTFDNLEQGCISDEAFMSEEESQFKANMKKVILKNWKKKYFVSSFIFFKGNGEEYYYKRGGGNPPRPKVRWR